jgi:hypothetical protein
MKETIKINSIQSSQSFDILENSPQPTNKATFSSYDILPITQPIDNNNDSYDILSSTQIVDNNNDSDNVLSKTQIFDNNNNSDEDMPNLDEDIHDGYTQVPSNTPQTLYLQSDNYDSKKAQINNLIKETKLKGSTIKERREVKSLERHLRKLIGYEKDGVNFNEVNKMMQAFIKNDNKMNKKLKSLYFEKEE